MYHCVILLKYLQYSSKLLKLKLFPQKVVRRSLTFGSHLIRQKFVASLLWNSINHLHFANFLDCTIVLSISAVKQDIAIAQGFEFIKEIKVRSCWDTITTYQTFSYIIRLLLLLHKVYL